MNTLAKIALVGLVSAPAWALAATSSANTEGVGQGVSVSQEGGFGKHKLTWSLRNPGQETVLATLREESKECSRERATKVVAEYRGGLTGYTLHMGGAPKFVLGSACYETSGDTGRLLDAMSLYSSGQLLPRKNNSHFKDRVDNLRDLLKWHRTPPAKAVGEFQIGPLQLERDYLSVKALLEGLGAEDVELAQRPSPYGQSLTVFAPQRIQSLDAVQLTLARAGRDTRITQFVGISEAPVDKWLAALTKQHGAPGRSEWEGRSEAHKWYRDGKELALESLGARSRIVWQDTSCAKTTCNAAYIPDDLIADISDRRPRQADSQP